MNSRVAKCGTHEQFLQTLLCGWPAAAPPRHAVVLECVVKVESEHDRCSKHPFLTQQSSWVIVGHTAMYFLLWFKSFAYIYLKYNCIKT